MAHRNIQVKLMLLLWGDVQEVEYDPEYDSWKCVLEPKNKSVPFYLDQMLWLNPSDNQGVRFLMDEVKAKRTWQAFENN